MFSRSVPVLACVLAVATLSSGACGRSHSAEGSAQLPERVSTPDSVVRAELLSMRRADQQARAGFGSAADNRDTVFVRQLLAGDSARSDRLKLIVQRLGWPSSGRLGNEAADAAWVILQHSPDTEWQAALLPLLQARADAGEFSPQQVALLTDRVFGRLGKPQRYGSQFSVVEGKLVVDPIEDIAGLDARRKRMGLPPMAEYVAQLASAYQLPVEWPPQP